MINNILHSSSRLSADEPMLNRFLKKPCLGASGISRGRNNSPNISSRVSLKKQHLTSSVNRATWTTQINYVNYKHTEFIQYLIPLNVSSRLRLVSGELATSSSHGKFKHVTSNIQQHLNEVDRLPALMRTNAREIILSSRGSVRAKSELALYTVVKFM